MLALQVIEGHNKVRIATVQRKGIRYRGGLHLPKSLERLDGGAADTTLSFGGAALGGIAFGAAGAIAGSMAGRRMRTAVLIQMTDGTDFVCTVASDEFPSLYVEVQRLIALAATGYIPPPPARVSVMAVFLGPFYFFKFGFGWCVFAFCLTIFTFGIGWLLLPAIAAYLDRRKFASISTDKVLAPPGSEFGGAVGDLLPADESGTTPPKR